MKTFKSFMEDGAVGSGAAGVQSSAGSPAITTSTLGVKGTGDDKDTVPVSKKKQSSLQARQHRVGEVKPMEEASFSGKSTKGLLDKMRKANDKRRIASTVNIKVGEKTAPAETFMTKEDKDPCWKGYEMIGIKKGRKGKPVPNCVPTNEEVETFKKGDKVYLKTKKLPNSPHTGRVTHVTDTHVHIDGVNGTYKAAKSNVTKDKTQSHLHRTYSEETLDQQKKIVKSNSTTDLKPAPAVEKPKKIFTDVRTKL